MTALSSLPTLRGQRRPSHRYMNIQPMCHGFPKLCFDFLDHVFHWNPSISFNQKINQKQKLNKDSVSLWFQKPQGILAIPANLWTLRFFHHICSVCFFTKSNKYLCMTTCFWFRLTLVSLSKPFHLSKVLHNFTQPFVLKLIIGVLVPLLTCHEKRFFCSATGLSQSSYSLICLDVAYGSLCCLLHQRNDRKLQQSVSLHASKCEKNIIGKGLSKKVWNLGEDLQAKTHQLCIMHPGTDWCQQIDRPPPEHLVGNRGWLIGKRKST